ncbi:hypothetical protein [Rhodococcus sp. HNM0569]|uniref:hypothetical protein n=1 Tax=Rhodococcus sp. HNM0569 TaxID=2716340 RepID=UPI00146C6BCB|nr:hypothetical protein [Rhodococcus sp. HNM0569]NLU82615.1 hypothetical protein [Rhodococcus sp. HNM0569]
MSTDVPPFLQSSFDRIMGAADDLATARIQAAKQRSGDWDMRTVIDDAFMDRLAESPVASDQLKAYAARVAAGECTWPQIDTKVTTLPPEIPELRDSPQFRWFPYFSPKAPEPTEDQWDEPYRIKWE